MDPIKRLKLAVFEASSEKLIDNETFKNMITFCENANLEDEDDQKIMVEMTDTLITLGESKVVTESATSEEGDVEEGEEEVVEEGVSVEEPVVHMTTKEIALEIFESERNGEITAEERDELLSMLNR